MLIFLILYIVNCQILCIFIIRYQTLDDPLVFFNGKVKTADAYQECEKVIPHFETQTDCQNLFIKRLLIQKFPEATIKQTLSWMRFYNGMD